MKKVSLGSLTELKHRVLSHGPSGAGKTRFLGTWPHLCAFCPKAEGGAITLQTMPKEDYYDEVEPVIYEIADMDDVKAIPAVAAREVAAGAQTIGIDSATFLSLILDQNIKAPGKQKWGVILDHMNDLRDKLHALDAHVVWTAGTEDSKVLIQGKTAHYLAHSVSFLFYHNVVMRNGVAEFQVHTNPLSGHLARTRLNNVIPSPLSMYVDDGEGGFVQKNAPCYKAIEQALELHGK